MECIYIYIYLCSYDTKVKFIKNISPSEQILLDFSGITADL